jgi:microcystin-dependent protein
MEKIFCVPDLRGRVIVGVDYGAGRVTANNTLGSSGGEETNMLGINNIPSHHHTLYGISGSSGTPYAPTLGSTKTSAYQATTEDTGGGQPHNNMQPYLVFNYIINTGQAGNRQNNQNINSEIIDQLQRQISDLNITLANLPIMPIGAVMEYSGTVGIPANFLECNGAAVSRVNYAQLFANIGTTYGNGDNVTTFNLPDKRGLCSVGIGSDGSTGGRVTNATAPNVVLGGVFGEENTTLLENNIPPHSHTTHCSPNTCAGGPYPVHMIVAGNEPRAVAVENTGTTGNGQPHNNMQPSIFMKFYIRAN